MKSPKSFTPVHPAFRIPGWSELLGPQELISAQDMVRHFLMTGETGSGKSVSCILRLLEAILRYPEDGPYRRYAEAVGTSAEPEETLRPALLVVDPKQELEELVMKEARGRRVTRMCYKQPAPVLHLFEGKKLEDIDPSAAVDFILQQSDFFIRDQARTDDPIWNMQAAWIIKDFVAIDMWLARAGKLQDFWDGLADALAEYSGFKSFVANLHYNRANYFQPIATVVALSAEGESSPALAIYLDTCEEHNVPGELGVRISTVMNLGNKTRSGVIWMANGILADFSAEDLASSVSLNPIEAPENMLSVETALNRGDAVIYVPTETTVSADLIGRCLKAKFFEFAFQRENQIRPFFYVVDEAHRFMTSGQQDGEQSLLDRCRAYRTGVVLATQSLASLAYRLNGYALQIVLNNCGNSFYFRTPDIETRDNLQKRIPNPPIQGRPHILS